jgi:hypothetical protein
MMSWDQVILLIFLRRRRFRTHQNHCAEPLAEPNEVEAAVLREVLKEIVPGQETRVMSIAAEQWKAEGIQIGEIRGKAKGIEAGKADLLLRQLRRRFGTLPESAQARVLSASEDQLNEWADNILDARTLDMVFGAAKPN